MNFFTMANFKNYSFGKKKLSDGVLEHNMLRELLTLSDNLGN